MTGEHFRYFCILDNTRSRLHNNKIMHVHVYARLYTVYNFWESKHSWLSNQFVGNNCVVIYTAMMISRHEL